MRQVQFREWLERRRYKGKKLTTINQRVNWCRAVERALPELGFTQTSLDAVHSEGMWDQLLTAMAKLRSDWRNNEAAARIIAPESENPSGQMANARASIGLYGRFANGDDPNYDSEGGHGQIDEKGLLALKARFLSKFKDFEEGEGFPGKSSFHPEEDTYKRELLKSVEGLIAQELAESELGGHLLSLVLDDKDINLVGDYRRKDHLRQVRRRSGGLLEAAVGRLALSTGDPPTAASHFGADAWKLVLEGSEKSKPYADIRTLATIFQALTRPDEAISVATRKFDNLGRALLGRRLFGDNVLTADEYREVLELARSLFEYLTEWGWQPRDLWDVQGFIWVTCEERLAMSSDPAAKPFLLFDEAGTAFQPVRHGERDGRSVFKVKPPGASNKAEEALAYESIVDVARAMLIEGLPARVKALSGGTVNYVAYGKQKLVRYELDPAIAEEIGVPATGSIGDHLKEKQSGEEVVVTDPTNLILYGPPGTGKTYATADEAVRLCDGLSADEPLLRDPAKREELRLRYDQLVEAGQVRMVTFHQNYSYEEFVEGLRPVTDTIAEGEEGATGAGFRLEPKRGIFREICAVAENARKNAGRTGGFDLTGRKLFKMSLGRMGVEDYIFDAAIEGGYAVLGWGGDVDWSDPRYDDWANILSRWQQENPQATGSDPNVVQMWPFRGAMKERDLIIVSAGNSHFRAIGEVTGPYRFEPTETRDYNHRRPVRWLLVPEEPLPTEMIYGKKFMMQSCYGLKDALVNKDALARLLPGGSTGRSGRPDQFVLVIDEINRANVSKVFGELITLIEPDKRLGSGAEALAVKLPYSGETFGVPANLHIVGTMNTADRSIATLDTALRRRFVFREIAPDPSLLAEAVDGVPLRRVLATINDRIEYLIDREHRIGHAFFMGEGGKDRPAIDRTMFDKVIPLLQEYFFEDWSRVAAVLGEALGKGGAFLNCRKLRDPTGQEGEERLSWSVRIDEHGRPNFSEDAYLRLVGKAAAAPATTIEGGHASADALE